MQLIGQTVHHQIFGKGVVKNNSQGMLTVNFPAGDKMFVYPDAFSKYLVLQNNQMQSELLEAMKVREEKLHQQEQAEIKAWEHKSALRNMKITSKAQAAFDVAPEQLAGVFSEWKISTGTYLSGLSKGEPRIPERVKPNSMCIITWRHPGKPENQRRIAGMFMAEDTFCKDQCVDGVIPAHPLYRLKLDESIQPLYWSYISAESSKQKWGNTSMKYLPNTLGNQILEDLAKKISPDQRNLLTEFQNYYKKINHLDSF